jgi:hypothetical protein
MAREKLQGLSREELIARAEAAGVSRPRSLTHAELVDELVLRGDAPVGEKSRARGWFGRAKDLLKTAIERGLTRPETGEEGATARPASRSWPPAPPPPLPTVTLAEIYAAQGHLERALQVLDEVLAKTPDHADAQRLRAAYAERIAQRVVTRPKPDAEAEADETDAATDRAADGRGTQPATRGATSDRADQPATAKGAPPIPPPPPSIGGPATAAAPPDDLDALVEIVAVAVDPATIYLYWEVRPATAARARVEAPHGALTVRTITVVPGSEGPLSDVRDDRVDALSGDLFVRGLRDGAHVRVSIGWRTDAAFVPLAVAVEVSTPRGAHAGEVARDLAAWSPPQRGGGLRPRFGGAPRPRHLGGAPADGHAGSDDDATTGGSPIEGAGPSGAPRRRILLQPTEVFTVSETDSLTTTYVTRLVGSSEMLVSILEGRVRDGRVVRRVLGGASDLAVGASDLSLR